MPLAKDQVAEIFYLADEFCKEFSTYFGKRTFYPNFIVGLTLDIHISIYFDGVLIF